MYIPLQFMVLCITAYFSKSYGKRKGNLSFLHRHLELSEKNFE